jgi:hypothetical protein
MSAEGAEPGADPRSDVSGGLCWFALGCVVLVGSWRMDRLRDQDIDPFTVPGLVPGLLGVGMMALAAVMLVRGWRRGGFAAAPVALPALDWRRLGLVLLLCVGFAAGLLGRVPFPAAASLFVAGSIAVLRWRELAGRRGRGLLQAAIVGLCSGYAVFVVFERLFLVRLP